MFDIPTVEPEDAILAYEGTEYPLTEDARTRLATAPDFSLDSGDRSSLTPRGAAAAPRPGTGRSTPADR